MPGTQVTCPGCENGHFLDHSWSLCSLPRHSLRPPILPHFSPDPGRASMPLPGTYE